jgi:hypothetical protein
VMLDCRHSGSTNDFSPLWTGIHTQREEAVDYVVSSAAAGALAIVS